MDIINKFEYYTRFHYCVYEDIETIIGKNNLIIFDDRKYLKYYNYLDHCQKYNYLHVFKKNEIKIKDIIISMTKDPYYKDLSFENEYIFLEGFEKMTEVQYKPIFGKWTEY